MTNIIDPIPFEISGFGTTGGGLYELKDNAYDYALDGLPFLSATRDAWPYSEAMSPIKKQQFDSFAEPGEQSLQDWWLRSQSSFTGGAGVLYQDPDTDNQFAYRFSDSLGADAWTPGELKLLRRTFQANADTSSTLLVRGFVDGTGDDCYWRMNNTDLIKSNFSLNTAIVDGAGTNKWLASSGKTYYLFKDNGVWTGSDAGAATQFYTWAATNTIGEFVKARVFAAVDRALYVLPFTGAPPIAIGTLTPVYTHPSADWVWTSITEGPNAIYVAGNDGTTGSIFKFTIELDGDVPVLNSGIVTARLPAGEKINTIYTYVGSFVGIATTKGFRVGEIDSNGDIAYGPLLFTPTGGCSGITGFDRFMWTGSTNAHDGHSGLYRVDLGAQIQEQTTRAVRYAYSRDVYAPDATGAITSVTMFGASDVKVFSATGAGVYREATLHDGSDTLLVPSGYLKTGRIRFNTEEPKLFKFMSMRTANPLYGGVSVSILTESGGEIPYTTYNEGSGAGTGDIATPLPEGAQNWIQLKFTLTPSSDPLIRELGGVLNGWQVKALPGSIRQRLITHTFLLFDSEMDKTGQNVGYDGYARTRFESFKALARAGDSFIFQELAENLSTQVVIDDWKFTQGAPPGPNHEVVGGYLTVVLKTVADNI
jgi:hypothetical protein